MGHRLRVFAVWGLALLLAAAGIMSIVSCGGPAGTESDSNSSSLRSGIGTTAGANGKDSPDTADRFLPGKTVPGHEAGDLDVFRKPDDPDRVTQPVIALLIQQRHIQKTELRPGRTAFIEMPAGGGKQMGGHQVIQGLPGPGIGKNELAEAAAVQGTVRAEVLRSESAVNLLQHRTAGDGQFT